jgi:hypothetical protein
VSKIRSNVEDLLGQLLRKSIFTFATCNPSMMCEIRENQLALFVEGGISVSFHPIPMNGQISKGSLNKRSI